MIAVWHVSYSPSRENDISIRLVAPDPLPWFRAPAAWGLSTCFHSIVCGSDASEKLLRQHSSSCMGLYSARRASAGGLRNQRTYRDERVKATPSPLQHSVINLPSSCEKLSITRISFEVLVSWSCRVPRLKGIIVPDPAVPSNAMAHLVRRSGRVYTLESIVIRSLTWSRSQTWPYCVPEPPA